LAAAGLGLADDVTPAHDGGDGRGLDGGWLLEAQGVDRGEHAARQAQVGKARQRSPRNIVVRPRRGGVRQSAGHRIRRGSASGGRPRSVEPIRTFTVPDAGETTRSGRLAWPNFEAAGAAAYHFRTIPCNGRPAVATVAPCSSTWGEAVRPPRSQP